MLVATAAEERLSFWRNSPKYFVAAGKENSLCTSV
jgi:hypothetical protein